MYPRIIHQIWFQGETQIPIKYTTYIKSIKELHLGSEFKKSWEYKLWDNIKILKLLAKYPKWKKIYNGFPYLHQKVDYAKYLILWFYGGVYIDIDVIALKSLEPLLDKIFSTSKTQMIVSELKTNFIENCIVCQKSRCINNGVIISQPRCNVLLEIIDHICANSTCSSFMPKFFCILRTTGPSIFTTIIDKSPNKAEVMILPCEYFEPCIKTHCEITENTYLKHVHANTWISESVQSFQNFYLQYRFILFIFIFIFIIIIIILCILSSRYYI